VIVSSRVMEAAYQKSGGQTAWKTRGFCGGSTWFLPGAASTQKKSPYQQAGLSISAQVV
jgi:hypothetical protein